MEKKEIKLTDEQIETISGDLTNKKLLVISLASKVATTEERLDTNFNENILMSEMKQLRNAIETKKDNDGRDIDEYLVEDLKFQVTVKEKEIAEGIVELQDKAARKYLIDLRSSLNREKQNIEVIESQLGSGKATITE